MIKIVGEISANHNQDINLLEELVSKASEIKGLEIIKIQCFRPESCTSKNRAFFLKSGKWAGNTLFELMEKAYMSQSLIKKAEEIIRKNNKDLMISINNLDDLKFNLSLKPEYVKLPSPESSDYFLARKILNLGFNLVLSTGVMNDDELEFIYKKIEPNLNSTNSLTVLHCVSNYPTTLNDVNLRRLSTLKKICPKAEVGISDHTKGSLVPILAASNGVKMIEKHIKINDKIDTLDSSFSLTIKEFEEMVSSINKVETIMGNEFIRKDKTRYGSKNIFWENRISAHAAFDLKYGHQLSINDVDFLRPGDGISPINIESFLGKKLNKDILKGYPIKDEFLNN